MARDSVLIYGAKTSSKCSLLVSKEKSTSQETLLHMDVISIERIALLE